MPKVSEGYFENKRKEIINAAYKVCASKPITSVEMKDIIAQTGFSHGVIYRYYKDLDEIFKDLIITINSENRIDDRLNEIIAKSEDKRNTHSWYTAGCFLYGRSEDKTVDRFLSFVENS